MSNSRRHRRGRRVVADVLADQRAGLAKANIDRLAGDYAMVCGWCNGDPDAIAGAKQRTHDAVIDLTGDRRLGGVTWRIMVGADECNRALDTLQANAAQGEESDHYRRLRAMVREYGGALVMAFCLADKHGILTAPKLTIHRRHVHDDTCDHGPVVWPVAMTATEPITEEDHDGHTDTDQG